MVSGPRWGEEAGGNGVRRRRLLGPLFPGGGPAAAAGLVRAERPGLLPARPGLERAAPPSPAPLLPPGRR